MLHLSDMSFPRAGFSVKVFTTNEGVGETGDFIFRFKSTYKV